MQQAEARTRLETMTQASSEPTLSSSEIDLLLDQARRADADGNAADRPWRASIYYPLDSYVIPTTAGGNGHTYRTTTAGVAGTTEPSWVTTSGATVSGTAGGGTALVFTEAGVPAWVPTWDLNAAAAEGWRWKAAKVANQFQFSADGQSFQRQQVYDHCLTMVQEYANKGAGTMAIGRF